MAQVWFSRPINYSDSLLSLARWWSHPSDWKACLVSHASYNRQLIELFGRHSIRKTAFSKVGLLSLFLSKPPPLALNWLAPFCLSFFTWAAALNHLMSALCIHRSPSSTLQLVTRDTSTLTPRRIKENKNKQGKRKFIMLTSLTPKQRHRHLSRRKQAKWKFHQKTSWWWWFTVPLLQFYNWRHLWGLKNKTRISQQNSSKILIVMVVSFSPFNIFTSTTGDKGHFDINTSQLKTQTSKMEIS